LGLILILILEAVHHVQKIDSLRILKKLQSFIVIVRVYVDVARIANGVPITVAVNSPNQPAWCRTAAKIITEIANGHLVARKTGRIFNF
jgi:hypothetical protein